MTTPATMVAGVVIIRRLLCVSHSLDPDAIDEDLDDVLARLEVDGSHQISIAQLGV